jgi:CubicO group peptidase (beta-lactamase class C family)
LPAPEALRAELRAILARAQAGKRLPSVAGAVVRDGEILWSDAVGFASTETGEEATPDHQYRIGSITKTFTAVAIMQLQEAGSLDLEDRLDKHLDVPARGELTLRRMLSHASGLQREIPGDVWDTFVFPETTEQLVATLEQAEQVLAPGERWHYSNLAYQLLGEVVARTSGMPYADYVEQRILRPLGLTRTGFTPSGATAVAYSVEPYTDAVLREPMMLETGGITAAGQMWSTVEDLCRWAAFIGKPDPDVLSEASIETMTAVQSMADPYRWTLAWGVGLMLVRRDEHVYAGHDGGMPGFLADVLVERSEQLGAAVLVNGANVDPAGLSLELIAKTRELFPAVPPLWRPSEPPPADLVGALGRWWSEGTEFVFRWHDGRLEVRAAEAAEWVPWTRFEALGDDRFRTVFGRERGELLRLVRDGDGNVTRLYWATYPFTRAHEVFGPVE